MSEDFIEATRLRDPAIGMVVNGYKIVGRLGQGGMGLVYEGIEPDIGKRVAIKVLLPELAADAVFLTRLMDEARAVNAIRHRGIIDIFGAGALPDGRKCILMEYLDGIPLEAEIQAAAATNRTMPVLRVLEISDEVLNALAAAHLANIVHRDLKPSNIFLCQQPNGDQHVKLLDFGIAKVAASGGGVQASAVLGTPLYMAPEQATADRLTSAIDMYAFGVILFELLTGRVPFSGESVARVMYHHINSRPPLASELNPAIPAALDAIVATLLAKEPGERPTAVDARQQLSRVRVALSDPSAMTTLDSEFKAFPADTLRAAPVEPRTAQLGAATSPMPKEPSPTSAQPHSRQDVTAVLPPGTIAGAPKAVEHPTGGPAQPLAPNALTADEIRQVTGGSTRKAVAALVVAALIGVPAVLWYSDASSPERSTHAGTPPAPVVAQTRGPAVTQPVPTQPVPVPPMPAPPMPAQLQPAPTQAAPPPVEVPPAAPSPRPIARPEGDRLAARLSRLETAIQRARARNEDMELAERQVRQLRAGLATAKTRQERELLEVAVARLEDELKE